MNQCRLVKPFLKPIFYLNFFYCKNADRHTTSVIQYNKATANAVGMTPIPEIYAYPFHDAQR